ncbi:MAG: hypothetical protein GAK43_02223 [Stenotrophomonas maltophilia]|nr:MAG: hypothetical protein GAK43_02223 [Stenotrophomonas maltophilia]
MTSRIWQLAGAGLLALAISGHALADGPGQGGPGDNGHGRPQSGQGGGQRPSGNPGNGGVQRPERAPEAPRPAPRPAPSNSPAPSRPAFNGGGDHGFGQGRPNGGQWQGGRPSNGDNDHGSAQGRPQAPSNAGQWQGGRPPSGGNDHSAGQGRPQMPGNAGQWQGGRPPSGGNDHGPGPGGNNWQGGRPGGQGGPGHVSRPPVGNWGPHPGDWRPGHVIDRVPPSRHRIPWRGNDFFFDDGYWYRPYGSRYIVVAPPYGVRVQVLPSYAEQFWLGSMLYYLAAGTYYQWLPDAQVYEVVAPPAEQVQYSSAPMNNPYDVVAYPANGQSPEQQASDHYQCHAWAVGQSGFDPAMVSYTPSEQAVDIYRRSLAACMTGRGYSVN